MPPGPRLVVMVALAFISGAQSSTNNQQQRENNILYNNIVRGKLLSKRDESAKYETSPYASLFLSNINPWLSACDLAQQKSAPGQQGSCSAGSLPRSRINEGPGPPNLKCLQCPHKKYENTNNNYENNINNNEYQNVNGRYNQNTLKTSTDNKQQQLSKNYNNNFSNSKSNNNYIKNNDMNRSNDENRQCLDYLGGDNDDNSPSKICESLSDIETKLKSLRLRHCCERDVASALHNEAYEQVKNDKKACKMRLNELIEVDKLAERITCEFREILVRYDCGHRYSLIHDCGSCKESYRRWVCSTFIPFFATKSEIKSDPLPDEEAAATTITADESQSSTGKAINIDSKAQKVFMEKQKNVDSNAIKRSRRKAGRIKQKRIRIRPCLSVCQTVEQICPYMLPADRAPAIPTQYAGEPTFLCLDPNIDETGNQLYKSNHGPSECCYNYCKHSSGLCSSTCDAIFNRNNETANIASLSTTTTSTSLSNVDDYDEVDSEDGKITSKQRTIHRNYSSSKLYVKLDNGTYVLNDFTNVPGMPGMSQCPANLTDSNVTQSTQKCVISQSQIASAASTSSSSISILVLLLLHVALITSNQSAKVLSSVAIAWNFETLKVLLQLATSTVIGATTHTTSSIIITGS